jgi:hypothetical protein
MTNLDLQALRRLALELSLPLEALEVAIECDLFQPDEPMVVHQRSLRQMGRIIRDLDVNPAGAVLIVRLRREVEVLQAETRRLRRRRRSLDDWLDGFWRDLEA